MRSPNILFGTGVSSAKDYDGLKRVISTAISCGIVGFDTAPSYQTEEILGKVLNECLKEQNQSRSRIFVQTKIDAWQMQLGSQKIFEYVMETLNKMRLDYLDSLLIHWPVPEYVEDTWNSFLKLKSDGTVKNIGICNVRLRHLNEYMSSGICPEIIQIERNPLNVCSREVEFCKENNILMQGYSPLCKMNSKLVQSGVLNELSKKYHKSIGQIIMRWHLDSGIAPIFTSTKPERIKEYSSIWDFRLQKSEISQIDSLNANYKLYLEAWACPGF